MIPSPIFPLNKKDRNIGRAACGACHVWSQDAGEGAKPD